MSDGDSLPEEQRKTEGKNWRDRDGGGRRIEGDDSRGLHKNCTNC